MRTTLDLDGDVLARARTLAREQGITLGAAVSALARRGMTTPITTESGFPVFPVPADAAPLTPELVSRANEDA